MINEDNTSLMFNEDLEKSITKATSEEKGAITTEKLAEEQVRNTPTKKRKFKATHGRKQKEPLMLRSHTEEIMGQKNIKLDRICNPTIMNRKYK